MLNKTFKPFPVLNTERLTLRQLAMHDEQEIFTLRSDNEINKYLGRHSAQTIDDARNFIDNITKNINENDSLYWAITVSDNNLLIGTICLYCFSDENDKCEIGFELLTNFQGRGIMREALEKVIDYAFSIIQVKKLEACVHRNNESSIKLLQKFSFRKLNEPGATNSDLLCYYLKKDD